jgi:hypothetical protein
VSENGPIDALADEFRSDDSPLMAFRPGDVDTKFFIGETIIVAAATIFVGAFYEGVKEALKEKGKSLGKTVTTWIVDKLEGLFKKPNDAKTEGEKVKKDLKDFSSTANKLGKKELKDTLDSTEKSVTETMKKRGVSPEKASEIAKIVRKSAEEIISKGI